jgi:hypothetical protein
MVLVIPPFCSPTPRVLHWRLTRGTNVPTIIKRQEVNGKHEYNKGVNNIPVAHRIMSTHHAGDAIHPVLRPGFRD